MILSDKHITNEQIVKSAKSVAISGEEGCLIGMAVGDSIGLPYESLSSRRAARLFPGPLRQRLWFQRGMFSDDTEHACMTAQAVLASGDDPEIFGRELARHLRWWIIACPAGVGYATLRSCIKLLFGFSPDRSGVYSAGNGPAMRSPLLGVVFGTNPKLLQKFVRTSTRLTHTDPRAEQGALLLAVAAAVSTRQRECVLPLHLEYLQEVEKYVRAGLLSYESLELVKLVITSLQTSPDTSEFIKILGMKNGISGYINHTTSAVLHIWLQFPTNFQEAITTAVKCGGDTDTVASILGGIIGARVTTAGIPNSWMLSIWESPRNLQWIKTLALALHKKQTSDLERPISFMQAIQRNAVFLTVILIHFFRRLLPPY